MKKLRDITGTYLWEYAEDDDEGKAFVILTGLAARRTDSETNIRGSPNMYKVITAFQLL